MVEEEGGEKGRFQEPKKAPYFNKLLKDLCFRPLHFFLILILCFLFP